MIYNLFIDIHRKSNLPFENQFKRVKVASNSIPSYGQQLPPNIHLQVRPTPPYGRRKTTTKHPPLWLDRIILKFHKQEYVLQKITRVSI